MKTQLRNTPENESHPSYRSVTNTVVSTPGRSMPGNEFVDNRQEAITQRKFQEIMNNSTRPSTLVNFQNQTDNNTIQRAVDDNLEPGTKVVINSGPTLLIGQKGDISEFDNEKQKYLVKLDETGFTVIIKPDALDLYEFSDEDDVFIEMSAILNGAWNENEYVTGVGKNPWPIIKGAWNSIPDEDKEKFTLVKLNGKRSPEEIYEHEEQQEEVEEKKEDIEDFDYTGWLSPFMGTQEGIKGGTETEGGYLKIKPRSALERSMLIAELKYFMRTPLIESDFYTLKLDNIGNSSINNFLKKKFDFVGLEVASKPLRLKKGKIEETRKKEFLHRKEHWPMAKVDDGKLIAKNGEATTLDSFNRSFISNNSGFQNVPKGNKAQHVTMSGLEEDRLKMAIDLLKIVKAEEFNFGTSGKKALSGQPKTSLEFLRDSSLSKSDSKKLEKIANSMRQAIRDKYAQKYAKRLGKVGGKKGFKQKKIEKYRANLKFADEELNGIIVPKTGVPSEIGGYLLMTPMTNVFPLLDIGDGTVSVLREFR